MAAVAVATVAAKSEERTSIECAPLFLFQTVNFLGLKSWITSTREIILTLHHISITISLNAIL